ncbi:RING finger protein nhl-1 isoform X3 [Prorops nasuta]|uniref:RING finger protein nhl-1 isoform X3 n=1 Tax=Prorops nasuta TaxID=863751 RepID=UPI0034CD4593
MEQFEQLLTCAICLDRYRNPKLLPCQHSFCMEPCMDGLVDYVRRQVKCPECRAEHRIPYQGVQAFPTNVTLQRFLELHIEITGELPDPTSGQTMERCGVCSEKSYCSLCVHCEKKCCPECKDAHMDILRREITRINSQVRRGLHRLQDALALVEKNTLGLQTNCASVGEEVDEIYRRLSKALKDRTEHLRNEVDRYLGTELRGLIQLKENLELEIANIQSNCDLAEAHINENVPWDDAELLDTKELFLRTVEFIRNFEYEAGDYNRRVRFVMAHDPNQLVLHVAGYGELNIKPEAGSGGLLGSTGGLAPPGGSPGLMRSKSDHRLASQYRQQEEERLARNRYVPEYEYDAPEYEAPRNKSRYRSRFMRHRDGDDSDGDTRSTVRFTSTQEAGSRERVLDTEDAARGPLSGIFRLTDSPRVMKKLQECERAGKRKKDEPAQPTQPAQPAPKSQVQVRKAPTAVARQVSEDDEISRIKKQNKNAPTPPETVEERQPSAPTPVHTPTREHQERETEELVRRTPITRRTSADTHPPTTRSASSDSSTGSESSTGSGIRSTGAPFTAEEMKQKYLSRAPAATPTTTVTSSPAGGTANRETTTTPANRPFQSRFLGAGNRAAPLPPSQPVREDPPAKKDEEEEDEDETSSSSEETETETEEESETDQPSTATSAAQSASQERSRTESAMARTDIGPLLARSAEARRGSKEDSPSTRYSTPRGSPALPATSPTGTTTMTTPTPTGTTGTAAPAMTTTTTPSSYTSRTFSPANDQFSRLPKEPGVTLSRSTPGPDQGTTSGTSSNASEHGGIPSASRPSSSEPKVTPSTSPSDQSLTEDLLSDCTDHPDEPKTLNNSIHQNSMVSHNDARAYKHSESLPNDAHRFLDLGSDEIHGRGEHTRLPIDAENFEVIEEDEEDEEESDSEEDDNCNTIILVESDEGSKDRSSQSITTLNGETNNPVVEEEDSEDQHDFHENGPNTNYDNFQDDEEEDSSDEEVEEVEDEEDEEEDNDTNKTTLRNNLENRESGLSTNDDNVNHYDLSLKRRSGSSIFEEKSIEELFDDNGWVVTDQDLQLDKPRIHTIKLEEGSGQGESVNHNDETESEKTETNDQTSEAKHNSETEPIDKETSTLRRIPQETGFDRDVRLVLEEPDRFAEKHKEQNHIFEQPRNILINAISNMLSPSISVTDENSVDLFINDKTLEESEKLEKDEEFSMDDKWMIDDNGWVILKGVGGLKSEMGEGKEVDLETGLNVERGIENGAVTNAKEIGRTDEDASGVALSIPMQMVTTVFCVSVLCYSVLINLFL